MTPKLTNDGRPGEEPNGAVMKLAVHFEKADIRGGTMLKAVETGQQHRSRQILGAHLVVAMAQIFLRELANLGARTGGKPGLSVFHA
jgi:hypothetical protein